MSLALEALLPLAAGAAPERVGAPNLLVIVIDAQRADHLSSYGYSLPTSPKIDAFAARAVRFTRAVAPSNRTGTAMPSIWTGLLPSRHGVFRRGDVLAESFTTAAELLRERGYRTGAWCPNPSLKRLFGYAQGWEEYDDDIVVKDDAGELPPWRRFETASTINARALEWIDRAPDRPFLAWLHYRDVHGPYVPPAPYDGMFPPLGKRPLTTAEVAARPRYLALPNDGNDLLTYVSAYDGDIRYMDERVAELLAELERRQLLDRTVVVITADHGEAFLEHGNWNHDMSLYEEEVHVPMVIARPATPPRVVDAVVSTLDLFPTLLELAGAAAPESDGESLVPLLEGRDEAYPRQRAYSESNAAWRTLQHAAREGQWKLIVSDSIFGSLFRTLELYDLAADPQERRNLARVEAERATAMAADLDEVVRRARGAQPSRPQSPPLNEKLRRELEALGYVR